MTYSETDFNTARNPLPGTCKGVVQAMSRYLDQDELPRRSVRENRTRDQP